MKLAIRILAVALVCPAVAEAQQAALEAGARVRVTSPRDGLKKHVTTVSAVRGDSMVVAGQAGPRMIALGDVTALDLSTGTRTQVIRDGLIGLGAGMALGFVVGVASYEEPDFLVSSAPQLGALVGVMFGTVGMVAGGVVGAMHRTDRWTPARMPVRTSFAPSGSGGISVRVSTAF